MHLGGTAKSRKIDESKPNFKRSLRSDAQLVGWVEQQRQPGSLVEVAGNLGRIAPRERERLSVKRIAPSGSLLTNGLARRLEMAQ
jgi:hypothetical protein